mgnify:CR=1 FL=1
MKKMKNVIVWILMIFIIYLIFEILRKIFGGSPGFEEIVIGLLIANLGYVIALHSKVSDIDSKLSGHIGWHRGKEESI